MEVGDDPTPNVDVFVRVGSYIIIDAGSSNPPLTRLCLIYTDKGQVKFEHAVILVVYDRHTDEAAEQTVAEGGHRGIEGPYGCTHGVLTPGIDVL